MDDDTAQEPFEDSRRLTGCNFYFAGTGAALETAPGLVFDDAALERWRVNIATAREALGWPEAEVVVRRHRAGASLAFTAPLDQLYAATEVNEWAWWAAVAFPFSPREKVPEGRMRERTVSGGATAGKKLPFDQKTRAFIRALRKNATDAETLVWGFVRNRRLRGQKFRRQQAMGPYVLDFYCHELKLAIEIDGGQHNEAEQHERDLRRDAFMAHKGVRTLRYWNNDVLQLADEVLVDIWEHVEALSEGSAASREGVPSSALRAPSPGGRREEQERRLFYFAPGHAAPWDADSALHTLQALAAAEARPALLALRDAANARGLPFLPDDDEVSMGAGEGGRTWSVTELPIPDEVEWPVLHAIPTALVTGSNGKTTTVRLIAAMSHAHGWRTAYSCTDGVFFDGEALESGDFSGPTGARTALRQPRAQAAVLETARGGMLRRGLALCRGDAAVVTNISADHFGEYGVHDLADLAAVKLTVARAIGDDGLLVLNADDAELVRQARALTCPRGWFALDFDASMLEAHRLDGGATCGARAGRLLLSRGDAVHDLGAIDVMPLTLGGRAIYNVANIAAAALAASALGIASETIAATLLHFGAKRDDNAGRLQHWRFGELDVYVDYAHNPDGLRGLLQAVGAGERRGRLAITLGHAGNRDDDDLRAVAVTAAAFAPDHVLLKDVGGYERGRDSGEIATIMRAELLNSGVPAQAVQVHLDEVEASCRAIAWARNGDLVVLPVFAMPARTTLGDLLDRMHAMQWQPGDALPLGAAGDS